MSNLGFRVFKPDVQPLPILLNISHSGSIFPRSEEHLYFPEILKRPPDTDWYLDRVYKFAPSLGVTMIRANYHRFLIDLDESAESPGLCPDKTYSGQPIYQKKYLSKKDIESRIKLYYQPYYLELESLIGELKLKFPNVFVCNARSLLSILTKNEVTIEAPVDVQSKLQNLLKNVYYEVKTEGTIFKKNLNSNFENPLKGIHSFQITLSQNVYLNEETFNFDEGKADMIRPALKNLFLNLN